jgi:hypothetical protein
MLTPNTGMAKDAKGSGRGRIEYPRILLFLLLNYVVRCRGHIASVIAIMQQWWSDIDRGKSKYWDRNLSQCHFLHHKSHGNWPGIEPGPPRSEAGNFTVGTPTKEEESQSMWAEFGPRIELGTCRA